VIKIEESVIQIPKEWVRKGTEILLCVGLKSIIQALEAPKR
jgi:hypothetical protein